MLYRLGPYDVLFRIAAGGMAEVFAARTRGPTGDVQLVAIKRMLPHMVDNDAMSAMFLDEARVTSHLESPHVVRTVDLGRDDDGGHFLVMELVVGVGVGELARAALDNREPLEQASCASIVIQAARGLADAHETVTPTGERLGLVHRDISPDNILVDRHGRVRLSDFGIAHAMIERLTRTQTGALKGKFAYFSPEQTRGQRLTQQSDVFALGIVAWELFARQKLFDGSGNPALVFDRVRSMEIPRLDAVDPHIPASFADVIARALERDPAARTESARAFATAMAMAAESLGFDTSEAVVAGAVKRIAPPRLGQLERSLEVLAHEPSSPGTLPGGPRHAARARHPGELALPTVLRAPPEQVTHVLSAPPPAHSSAQTSTLRTWAAWIAAALMVSAIAGTIAIALWSPPPETTTVEPTAPRFEEARALADPLLPPGTPTAAVPSAVVEAAEPEAAEPEAAEAPVAEALVAEAPVAEAPVAEAKEPETEPATEAATPPRPRHRRTGRADRSSMTKVAPPTRPPGLRPGQVLGEDGFDRHI